MKNQEWKAVSSVTAPAHCWETEVVQVLHQHLVGGGGGEVLEYNTDIWMGAEKQQTKKTGK